MFVLFFIKFFNVNAKFVSANIVLFTFVTSQKIGKTETGNLQKKSNALSQPKLNFFFGFTDAIKEMIYSRLNEVKSIDDAMAIVSPYLSASKKLSGNVCLRNTLQNKFRFIDN